MKLNFDFFIKNIVHVSGTVMELSRKLGLKGNISWHWSHGRCWYFVLSGVAAGVGPAVLISFVAAILEKFS